MDTHWRVLEVLKQNPGSCKTDLCESFGLSKFRLNRALRLIEREMDGIQIVHDNDHRLWIVETNPSLCMGVVWRGGRYGCYCQCSERPAFADNRCYEHSDYETPEMTAFQRELAYAAGVQEPTPFFISQLTISEVEVLLFDLNHIIPITRKEFIKKRRLTAILRSSLAVLKWKESMKRRVFEEWIPDDMWERHRRSSFNPFEVAVKKYFIVLEVNTDATRDEVLQAWKKLARKYHPDTENGDEERMKLINSAKEKIFRIKRWT